MSIGAFRHHGVNYKLSMLSINVKILVGYLWLDFWFVAKLTKVKVTNDKSKLHFILEFRVQLN